MLNGPAPSLFAVQALLNWSAALANETTILTNNVIEILYKRFSLCGSQVTSHDFLIQREEQVSISAYTIVKTGGILLKTVGGGVGSVSCDSSLYLTESCFIFSTIFQT